MTKEIETIKTLVEYQDYLEVGFQLDSSFQRCYVVIRDPEMKKKLEEEKKSFGHFAVELFRGEREEEEKNFDDYNHLSFLRNLHRNCLNTSSWSSDGRTTDVGAGLLLFMSNKKLMRKLDDAVRVELDRIRVRILDQIGGRFEGLDEKGLVAKAQEKVLYHQDKVDKLKEEIAMFIPGSERHKTLIERLAEQEELLKAFPIIEMTTNV